MIPCYLKFVVRYREPAFFKTRILANATLYLLRSLFGGRSSVGKDVLENVVGDIKSLPCDESHLAV